MLSDEQMEQYRRQLLTYLAANPFDEAYEDGKRMIEELIAQAKIANKN